MKLLSPLFSALCILFVCVAVNWCFSPEQPHGRQTRAGTLFTKPPSHTICPFTIWPSHIITHIDMLWLNKPSGTFCPFTIWLSSIVMQLCQGVQIMTMEPKTIFNLLIKRHCSTSNIHLRLDQHNTSAWCELEKVNRCLARYSPRATTTNQQGTKWASKAYMYPRKHIWGQKWPFLDQTS